MNLSDAASLITVPGTLRFGAAGPCAPLESLDSVVRVGESCGTTVPGCALSLLANLKLGNSLTLTGASCCAGVRSELSAGCRSGWLLLFEGELVSGSSTA